MGTIEDLDLKTFITSAINNVFDTMLSMEVEVSETDSKSFEGGNWISGIANFSGDLAGNINFQVSDLFARLMTASMLGEEPDEIEDEEEIKDVISELISIISGNLKTSFSGAGFSCEFSTPSITTGNDSKDESAKFLRHELFAFRQQKHTGILELSVIDDSVVEDASEPSGQLKPSDDNIDKEKDDLKPLDGTEEEIDEDIEVEKEQPEDEIQEPQDQFETLDDGDKKAIDDVTERSEDQDEELPTESQDQFETLDDSEEEIDRDVEVEKEQPEDEIQEPQDQFETLDDGDKKDIDGVTERGEDQDEELPTETQDHFKTLDDSDEEEVDGDTEIHKEESGEELFKAQEQFKALDDIDDVDGIEDTLEKKIDEDEEEEKRDEKEEKDEVEGEEDEEEEKKKGRLGLFIKIALAIVIVFVCIFGVFVYKKAFKDSQKSSPIQQIEEDTPAHPVEKPESGPLSLIEDRLKKISELRNNLFIKQKDIAALQQHYQNGIDEVENELIKKIRVNNVTSFKQALKTERIELGLRTIQRRNAYIQQLDKPSQLLFQISEQLLYLKRKTEIDIKMVDVTEDIDTDILARRIDTEVPEFMQNAEKLTIGIDGAKLDSLENIWEKILAGSQNPKRKKALLSQEDKKNHDIWHEICDGNFDRKYELTELSPDAAKCLSEWEGKDLFLNGLTRLSPETAQYLSQWHGEWLSLNGLTKISPETAKYLSQWHGEWLSLNGLAELPPEVCKYLSQWHGKQIEMISLKHLAQWKKSGGRLFLPERFKKQIEQMIE